MFVAAARDTTDSDVIMPDHVIGFVEVYTPDFLASTSGQAYPERVRAILHPYVASLAVDETARKCGVGTALMHAVERECALISSLVILEVEDTNRAAISLYERLGYSRTAKDTDARTLSGDVLFGRSVRVTKLRFEKGVTREGSESN